MQLMRRAGIQFPLDSFNTDRFTGGRQTSFWTSKGNSRRASYGNGAGKLLFPRQSVKTRLALTPPHCFSTNFPSIPSERAEENIRKRNTRDGGKSSGHAETCSHIFGDS